MGMQWITVKVMYAAITSINKMPMVAYVGCTEVQCVIRTDLDTLYIFIQKYPMLKMPKKLLHAGASLNKG